MAHLLRLLPPLLSALLAACAGRDPSEVRLMPPQHSAPMLALASGRTLVPVVDVALFELGPALLPVPRAQWTQEARGRVEPVLDVLFRGFGIAPVRPPQPAEAQTEGALAALRDLVLTATMQPLRSGFARATFGHSPPTQVPASPVAPDSIIALARPIAADFVLFVFLRESRATEALRASNQRRASLGAPAGLSTSLFFGVATAYAVLVDLKQGLIVGVRGFVAGDPSPSLLDAAGAEAILRSVLI